MASSLIYWKCLLLKLIEMDYLRSILILSSLNLVCGLSSCSDDNVTKDETYTMNLKITPITDFGNIGKNDFIESDSISLFAWQNDVEIVDPSCFIYNNILWGFNGNAWSSETEFNSETTETIDNIVLLYPQLKNSDLEYMQSIPLNHETDLLYCKANIVDGNLPNDFALKSVFSVLSVSFTKGEAPLVNSISLSLNNQAYLNALTGDIRTTDSKEMITLAKSENVSSVFLSRIVPQTLLSGTVFKVSGVDYTYAGDDVYIEPGKELILNFEIIPGDNEDKGIVNILNKEDFNIEDFGDYGTVEGELDTEDLL